MEAATVAGRAAPARVPRTHPAPTRRPPSRPAPRPRAVPGRRPAAQLIPIAVGTAAAVRQLPDSTLVVRLTRGRLWIGVLGVLLAGIVALNVYTLSLAAKVGPISQNVEALESENSLLRSRDAERSGAARVRHDAGALGMEMAAVDQVATIEPHPGDAAAAAQRLAAAGAG